MTSYVLKRLLHFFPTLLLVTMVAFGLSRLTPGDPVEIILGTTTGAGQNREEIEAYREAYLSTAETFNFDKPAFYFSILPRAYPDTLYKILPLSEREYCTQLIRNFGNWKTVSEWRKAIKESIRFFQNLKPPRPQWLAKVRLLSQTTDPQSINYLLNELHTQTAGFPRAHSQVSKMQSIFTEMQGTSRYNLLIPKVVWHGTNNQYHRWLSGFIRGELGRSYIDKKPVAQKIMQTLPNTLWLNIAALFFALVLGVELGIYLAVKPDRILSKLFLSKVYVWLSLPTFWLASLLILFFTTDDYGSWTNIFPAGGIGEFPADSSFLQKIYIRISYLFLPVISFATPLLGMIALQVRRALSEELKKDYIKTALLKGISYREVVRRHGLRNALFPLVTMFGTVLPGLIGGSVVIEHIFNIPGMGRLLLHSIYAKDWAVVFSIIVLTGVLTIVSLLLADIFYSKLDPRVRLQSSSIKGNE